ncbi:flagellar protein FliS [Erwinia endophytica]|uniref:flagellar export chaperone FliS n=1 Tax=Erwinia endophytica TaxID=1563158 RepID=UPI001265EB55|nr:flagellar protein FliS [Erwinia endophytica]KAB8312465.1 flagellar protein FliS [Erwinia endophytica]
MRRTDNDLIQNQDADLAVRPVASALYQQRMLCAGLLDELTRAKGHFQARCYTRMADSLNKGIDLLNTLTSALDFENGGELALRLACLYDYCVYRLYDASHQRSIERIKEVEEILGSIQENGEGIEA